MVDRAKHRAALLVIFLLLRASGKEREYERHKEGEEIASLHGRDAVAGIGGQDASACGSRWPLPVALACGQDLRDLFFRAGFTLHTHNIEATVRDVDMNEIVILDQGDGASFRGFGGDMADCRTTCRAGEASVGDQGDRLYQFRIGRNGFCRIEHLRHTASLGSFITDKESLARMYLLLQHRFDGTLLTVEHPCLEHHVH